MVGILKSDCDPVPFHIRNQQKINDAVAAVERRLNWLRDELIQNPRFVPENTLEHNDVRQLYEDMRTLLDVTKYYSAHVHHFSKYHAADEDAFMRGEFYLGTGCVNCEFSRSQQRAINESRSGGVL